MKSHLVRLRRADSKDLAQIKNFHITNHLAETCHCPGERENQINDLEVDFPQLFSQELFDQGKFWVVEVDASVSDDTPTIFSGVGVVGGVIGLTPDKDDKTIAWLNTFSVAKEMRGKQLGRKLLNEALKEATLDEQVKKVRLVTLGNHSEGKEVMSAARNLYEKNGFEIYSQETGVQYGEATTIDVLYYEKFI
eukprot:CAMPEP_0178964452 /NCGR_PEP_ID=MMETSP0789-20121207/15681_1 /TAXON_ID=3005 /ORGANISM="Rhizosolenia setigera, Strain CCMP 1694" /LENGTH=192 /DNA_ID=CAMNT_0020649221 /DNA_START=110 /DNA_END=688 /DNA_ORIENTATION=-